jgi:hypothetical protein
VGEVSSSVGDHGGESARSACGEGRWGEPKRQQLGVLQQTQLGDRLCHLANLLLSTFFQRDPLSHLNIARHSPR